MNWKGFSNYFLSLLVVGWGLLAMWPDEDETFGDYYNAYEDSKFHSDQDKVCDFVVMSTRKIYLAYLSQFLNCSALALLAYSRPYIKIRPCWCEEGSIHGLRPALTSPSFNKIRYRLLISHAEEAVIRLYEISLDLFEKLCPWIFQRVQGVGKGQF